MKTRRHFLKLSFAATVYLAFTDISLAVDCNDANVKKWRKACISALTDFHGMLSKSREVELIAFNKAEEALEPSLKCAKGAYDISMAAAAYCNPKTSGTNYEKCAGVLYGIPDVVKACSQALSLIQESLKLYEQALYTNGMAKVGFSEQGGDEALANLSTCGESHCQKVTKAFFLEVAKSDKRIRQNMEKLKKHEKVLMNGIDRLQKCKEDYTTCSEVPTVDYPVLESPDTKLPDIPRG